MHLPHLGYAVQVKHGKTGDEVDLSDYDPR